MTRRRRELTQANRAFGLSHQQAEDAAEDQLDLEWIATHVRRQP